MFRADTGNWKCKPHQFVDRQVIANRWHGDSRDLGILPEIQLYAGSVSWSVTQLSPFMPCLSHMRLFFSVHFVPDEAGEWGLIYENATGNGVMGAVVERRADVGFTALYLW